MTATQKKGPRSNDPPADVTALDPPAADSNEQEKVDLTAAAKRLRVSSMKVKTNLRVG